MHPISKNCTKNFSTRLKIAFFATIAFCTGYCLIYFKMNFPNKYNSYIDATQIIIAFLFGNGRRQNSWEVSHHLLAILRLLSTPLGSKPKDFRATGLQTTGWDMR